MRPQSIALQSIILDPERRAELRLKAIATLMKIDPEAAAASALGFRMNSTGDAVVLTSYLENPQTEPWEVLVRFPAAPARSWNGKHRINEVGFTCLSPGALWVL